MKHEKPTRGRGRPRKHDLARTTISVRLDTELLGCLDRHRPKVPRSTKVEEAVVTKLKAEGGPLPPWAITRTL